MRNAAMDDLEKEKTVQRCAVEMVKQSVALFVKLAVIMLVTVLPVWLASLLGWADIKTVGRFALRVDVLLITTAVIFILAVAYRQINKA